MSVDHSVFNLCVSLGVIDLTFCLTKMSSEKFKIECYKVVIIVFLDNKLSLKVLRKLHFLDVQLR